VSGRIHVKIVYTLPSGKLLGGQIVGPRDAAKRIDTLSVALTAGLNVRQLSQLDLAYAPPFSTLLDPIQIAANVALRELRYD
jgi:NADPH-dependent 2,4-dienoyl-CoA reductase/sulfur reductase-like enzyme